MIIRFSNRIGLLSLLGVIAGAILAGLNFPTNPYLAAIFVLLAIVSFVVFCLYLYNFVFYSPVLELPEEERDDDLDKE